MPKISIIVPVYNVELYLDRCVQSLINQTFRDIEIILVDDKSTDNCPKLCDQYAEMDSRIKVIHREENGGLGYARNSGMDMALGKYITFLDSDDYVDLCLYDNVYQVCEQDNLEICYFRHRRVDEKGHLYSVKQDSVVHDYYTKEDSLQLLLSMMGDCTSDYGDSINMSVSVCMALYRLDVIKRNKACFKSEREVASEDLVFHIDLLPNIKRIKVIPNVYYNYFVNTNSISTSYDDQKFWRFIRLLELMEKKLPQIYPSGNYKNSFARYILRTFKVILRFESWQDTTIRNRCKRINEVCGLDICEHLYTSPVIKLLPHKDRLIVFCMKHRISLFFIFLYKEMYHKHGVRK